MIPVDRNRLRIYMGRVPKIDQVNRKELSTFFQLETQYDHGLNTSSQQKQKSPDQIERCTQQASERSPQASHRSRCGRSNRFCHEPQGSSRQAEVPCQGDQGTRFLEIPIGFHRFSGADQNFMELFLGLRGSSNFLCPVVKDLCLGTTAADRRQRSNKGGLCGSELAWSL